MYVQILTNRPRDAFYVAVLDGQPIRVGWGGQGGRTTGGPRRDAAQGARMGPGRDTLLDRAQAKRGEEFLQTFVQQLRERFKVTVNENAKGADNDVGG